MRHKQQDMSILDGSPIAALYEREALMIFAYVLRRVPTREDAEDILLEVFLAALEREDIAELSEEKQRAWLLRVAHNKMVDHHRYARHRTAVPLEDVTETLYEAADREPDQLLLQQEEYALLRTNITQLPALQQEIVRLRYALGLRNAEIARLLNKREPAIRQLLSRSIRFLRDLYKHE